MCAFALLYGRKVMTNLDSILKSRDITLPTKVLIVKTMVFPVVMYGCESWSIMKAECWGIDAFELWCWRRLLRVPWTAKRSNQSILKETNPRCSLEGLMLRLKLQYFGQVLWRVDSLEKTLMLGKMEKAMAPHSSTLAWKIPWMEEPGGLQSVGSLESDTTERFRFDFSLSCIGERNGNPLQYSCLENPRDGGAWWAAVYWVTESDMTEAT